MRVAGYRYTGLTGGDSFYGYRIEGSWRGRDHPGVVKHRDILKRWADSKKPVVPPANPELARSYFNSALFGLILVPLLLAL
tara:strand:+ start:4763 stop:5005 length:243 start_codon:yes stop_codon:yes gene_type:complete